MKQILKWASAGLLVFGSSAAMADTATFGNANVWYGTNTFTAVDIPSGLEADAAAAQDARGVWNVWTNPIDHLTVANNTDPANPGGVTFSYPGRTFDLTALKLFGYYFGNPRAAGKTLQYNILAYHPGNPTPVVVTFTIKSLAAPVTKIWNDPRLQGLDKAVIQFAPTVGKTYFIETTFNLN